MGRNRGQPYLQLNAVAKYAKFDHGKLTSKGNHRQYYGILENTPLRQTKRANSKQGKLL